MCWLHVCEDGGYLVFVSWGHSANQDVLCFIVTRMSLSLQSFPYLLKELAEFVTLLPKEGQDVLLDDMHSHVTESDDVTRKPILVSWLQSLSYISSQSSRSESHSKATNASSVASDELTLNRTMARLWYYLPLVKSVHHAVYWMHVARAKLSKLDACCNREKNMQGFKEAVCFCALGSESMSQW